MAKPKIRFNGYTEDWEQRKLGDVLERRIEQRQQSEEYPRLAFASGQGVIPLSERKTNNREQLTKDEYTKKYLVTELNDIVYNPANVKYGAIDRNKCGRGLISPIYVTFTTNEIPGFIERIVTSHDFQQRALRFEEGTVTKRQSVNPEDLVTLDILVAPKREEQQKIATYFDNIDHLITLHQRKCEQTKTLKKYMLQKMFPQDGEKVPQIRFEGFTEDWEQRKLGEVFKEYSEKNHTELPALTIIQGGGTVKREESDRNLMYDESNLSNYKMVRKDDFIVHLRSFEGGLEKSLLDGIISPAYHTFHSDVADSRFYYPYFRSHEFIKHKLVPHVYGIRDGRSIDIAGMKTIEIPYTSIEEQRKIGDYLESLDNLITLHQRKCDELKEVKKFMLQNMFV